MLFRVVMAVFALALAGTVPGCAVAGADRDVLVDLVASVPEELAQDGLLLRRGGEGHSRLIAQLGLAAEDVQASLTTGAPAVRLLRSDAAPTVTALLRGDGFTAQEAPEGWDILQRPEESSGFVGIPAVAVGPGLIAVGSIAELVAVAGDGPSLPVAEAALAAAQTALVKPAAALGRPPASPVATGSVPAFTSVVLSAAEDAATGRLALRLPAEGDQEDAVGLAVRVRTAGPVDGTGRLLIEPSAALTNGDVVSLEVRWVADGLTPSTLLAEGLGSGLLDFLGAS